MSRRRMYNTVRTDTFEDKIAFYEARQNYEPAEALRSLARACGAPIDAALIAARASKYRQQLDEWRQQRMCAPGGIKP